jgi:hypothetical protein
VDSYRDDIVSALEYLPFHQRAIQQLDRRIADAEVGYSSEAALGELAEIRARLDLAIERMG